LRAAQDERLCAEKLQKKSWKDHEEEVELEEDWCE
jgi:hypothetical protein